MKNQRGIVWAPLLIIIGAVVVAGFATYFLIQNSNSTKSENTNVVVMNQTNSNASENINSVANTNQLVNTNSVSHTNTNTDATAGWKTYENTELGFRFKYPAEFGEVKLTVSSGDTGKKFGGTFTAQPGLTFGGNSNDYGAGRSGGMNNNDTVGYQNVSGTASNPTFEYKSAINGQVTSIKLANYNAGFVKEVNGVNRVGILVKALGPKNGLGQIDTGDEMIIFNLGSSETFQGVSFLDTTIDISEDTLSTIGSTFKILGPYADSVFKIQEWGVELQTPNGPSDLQYVLVSTNSAKFTSATIKQQDPNCYIGYITRQTTAKTEGPGVAGPIVAGYYYYYTSPQSACFDSNNKVINFQHNEGDLWSAFETLRTVL